MEYKKEHRNGHQVIECTFTSISEYIDYLDSQKTSPVFRKARSHASSSGSFEFTGTKSYKQARDMCLFGEYSDDFNKFDQSRIELERKLSEKNYHAKIFSDVQGFSPNVPAYLQGQPLNMYNNYPEETLTKPKIRIIYNVSAPGNVNKEALRIRGVCTLALMKQLEDAGFDVELMLVECSKSDNQVMITKWIVKKPEEEIDYRSVYFPLVNPSFLRRLHFRQLEVNNDLHEGWTGGYGKSLRNEEMAYYLNVEPTDVIIGDIDSLNIYACYDDLTNYKNFCEELNIVEKMTIAKEQNQKNNNTNTQKI